MRENVYIYWMKSQVYSMYVPPHPGEILKEEYIEPLELTLEQTVKALDIPAEKLQLFIDGKIRVDGDLAARLSETFGTSVDVWLNMQNTKDIWDAALIRENLKGIKVLYKAPEEESLGIVPSDDDV